MLPELPESSALPDVPSDPAPTSPTVPQNPPTDPSDPLAGYTPPLSLSTEPPPPADAVTMGRMRAWFFLLVWLIAVFGVAWLLGFFG